MSDRFAIWLPITLAHEGGYVDHPKGLGCATNLGITIKTLSGWLGRPATKAEVKALKRADVAPIYRRNYWDAAGCDRYLPGADLCLFDGSVNSGVSRGVGWAKQVKPGSNAKALVDQYCDARLGFLTRLVTWSTFGKGWSRRVAGIRAKATTMALAWMGVTGAAAKQQLEAEATRADSKAAADRGRAAAGGSAGATTVGVPMAGGVTDATNWIVLTVVAAVILGATAFLIIRSRNRRDEADAFRQAAANV